MTKSLVFKSLWQWITFFNFALTLNLHVGTCRTDFFYISVQFLKKLWFSWEWVWFGSVQKNAVSVYGFHIFGRIVQSNVITNTMHDFLSTNMMFSDFRGAQSFNYSFDKKKSCSARRYVSATWYGPGEDDVRSCQHWHFLRPVSRQLSTLTLSRTSK